MNNHYFSACYHVYYITQAKTKCTYAFSIILLGSFTSIAWGNHLKTVFSYFPSLISNPFLFQFFPLLVRPSWTVMLYQMPYKWTHSIIMQFSPWNFPIHSILLKFFFFFLLSWSPSGCFERHNCWIGNHLWTPWNLFLFVRYCA